MMKKIGCFIFFFSVFNFVNAQVGVNTTSPKASLDIEINDAANPTNHDGILIPRIDTFPSSNPTTDQNAMLVYLTTAVGTNNPGFYYWDNTTTTWIGLQKAGAISKIIDTDLDTKIDVEESTDEDVIHFDIAGTEYFTMKNGRINVLNTGNSTFIGENAGLNDDFSNNFNTAIGTNAFRANTSGFNNAVLGFNTLIANQTGYQNVVVGAYAMNSNVAGCNNTVIGMDAGRNATGSNNVFLGIAAGRDATGNSNVFLGNQAGLNEIGNNKLYIENTGSTSPLIYGEFDTNLLRVNGILNVNNSYSFPTIDGTTGQALITDGSGLITWADVNGEKTKLIDTDLDTKIEVEASADEDIIRFTNAGVNGLNINANRLETTAAIGHTVKIGFEAGLNDDNSDNRNNFIGFRAGKSNTTGNYNNSIGAGALQLNTTGSENIALGYVALNQNLTGGNNVAIGSQTLYNNTIGQYNIALGNSALRNNIDGNHNIALGLQALYNNITSESNIALGTYSLLKLNSGNSNVSIGQGTLREMTSGISNTAVGVNAGLANTSGNNNTLLGYQAGGNASTGSSNIFIGYQSGYNESGDNKLYIENSNAAYPLVYGEFETDYLQVNGSFDVGTNGDGTIARANSWNTFSDRRWKTNFKKIENALGKLNQINGYYYNWKDKKDQSLQVGVIAQEIEVVLPEIVSTDKNGYKSADYSKISALLIQVAKEQQGIIENQETKIEELSKKYTDLAKEIEKMKQLLASKKE